MGILVFATLPPAAYILINPQQTHILWRLHSRITVVPEVVAIRDWRRESVRRHTLPSPTLNNESTNSTKRDPSTIPPREFDKCPLRSIQIADLGLKRYFAIRVDQTSPFFFCPSPVIGVTHSSQP